MDDIRLVKKWYENNEQILNFFSKTPHQSVINPNWDFQNMGVGGLDKQFNAIFRRAFSSRVFPPEVVEQLGKIPFAFFFKRLIHWFGTIAIHILIIVLDLINEVGRFDQRLPFHKSSD